MAILLIVATSILILNLICFYFVRKNGESLLVMIGGYCIFLLAFNVLDKSVLLSISDIDVSFLLDPSFLLTMILIFVVSYLFGR